MFPMHSKRWRIRAHLEAHRHLEQIDPSEWIGENLGRLTRMETLAEE